MINKESLLKAAGEEYVLEHVSETKAERMGRRSAICGMMVRLGLYDELEAAIDLAIVESKPIAIICYRCGGNCGQC